jgi:histidine triad (HIT) family protein
MAENDTIFGKIARGEIPADIVYEDDQVVAFRDLHPQAPTHVLVIPRKPIPTLNDAADTDAELIGRLFLAAAKIAAQLGLAEDGYRTVVNCNEHGGQTVFHLHVHLLGGRPLQWPPG